MNFVGRAVPLTRNGLREAANIVGCDAATILAIIDVETAGCGFFRTRQLSILFERHIFHRETGGRFSEANPDIAHPVPGGHGLSGPAQYVRLNRAMALDTVAAIRATSWGLGQIMGFNCRAAGFGTAEEMAHAFLDGEDVHLAAMVRFIVHEGIDDELRRRDWAGFAARYNGKNYWQHRYHIRLAERHSWHAAHEIDWRVRDMQMQLMFAGYYHGRIDGIAGPRTREAEARAVRSGAIV